MSGPRVRRLRLSDFLVGDERCHFADRTLAGDDRVPTHAHDFVEMFWIPGGRGVESTPRGRHPLAAGDVVFVPADAVHGFEPADDATLTIRNLAFPRAAWRGLRARYGDALADPFAARAAARRHHLPHLLGALDEAAAELREGRRSRLALDRFLLRLDALLPRDVTGRGPGPDWLIEAVRWLAGADAASLASGTFALIDRCGRSGEHVARCCRQHLGKTPTQLVEDARLRRAAALLAGGDRPVLDVCYDSGFNNVGHFHARFLAHFGETPRRYRQRARATVG